MLVGHLYLYYLASICPEVLWLRFYARLRLPTITSNNSADHCPGYLEERYQISTGLQGPKRLEGEDFEDYKIRRKAKNGLLKEYLRGVWVKDD